jgi:hypothetical protein
VRLLPRVVLLLAAGLVSCAPKPSRYLYVWAGTGHASHGRGTNFLAILNADPTSSDYGKVIDATVADSGMMPHHAEFVLPINRPLFVNDFMTGENLLIDHQEPLAPRVMGRVDHAPRFRMPHSFARFQDSLVVATLQFGDSSEAGNPGGLAMFSDAGRLLRSTSARDSTMPGAPIRPYGLTLLPAIDRIVTTSSPMDTERTADVIQIWRLSDLSLLKTVPVPGAEADSLERYPFELRTMADGRTVLLNSYNCGLYVISGIDGPAPAIELVHQLRNPTRIGCSVPVLTDRWWVMPIAYGHTIVSMDIRDPARPQVVSELNTDSTFFPHWLSADPASDRVVVTEQGDGPGRVMMLRLDRQTGKLSWDEKFRDQGATTNGIDFTKRTWPKGISGAAMPHAALFVP